MSQAPIRSIPRTASEEDLTREQMASRLDENLDAINSEHSGPVALVNPAAGLKWLDTSSEPFRRKYHDGVQWHTVASVDPDSGQYQVLAGLGTAASPGLSFAVDTDSGFYRVPGEFELKVAFGGLHVMSLAPASNAVALAGTNTKNPVTSAGLASVMNLGNPGYQKFPGGLIIQYGSTVVLLDSSGTGTILFPLTFPVSVYSVVGWNGDMTGGDAQASAFGAISDSLTSFRVAVRPNPGAIGVRFSWVAFGR